MYGLDFKTTFTGSFEVGVIVPREDRVISGLEIPQVPVVHIFTEAAVFSGQLDGLEFNNDQERQKFAKFLGQELMTRGAQPVAAHS